MAEGGYHTHSCSICLDDFTKPKLLPCSHTFCELCLDNYIKTHSQFNKFNCPNCRTQIRIPIGGFPTNIYIQPKGETKNHFCTRHKTKEVEFYCRDCSVAVCGSCLLLDHTTHSKTDLTEVDREIRWKLNIIKGELEGKVDEVEKHCESLTNHISDIKNQATKACHNVDIQVQNVCGEVRKHGDEIKCAMNKICEEERNKLQTLHEDMTKFKSSLQSSVKYITDVLNDKSTAPVVDALTNAQTLTEVSRSTSFVTPALRYVLYPMVNVDVKTLQQLLGEFQIMESPTWTTKFSLDQIVTTDMNYRGDEIIIQGIPWSVCAENRTSAGLCSFLFLNIPEDKTVKSVTANYSLKLLNINNVSQSIINQYTYTFTPGNGNGFSFIEWNKLEQVTNGFINNKNTFYIQASVKINNIERY